MRIRTIVPFLLFLALMAPSAAQVSEANIMHPIAEFGGWGNQTTHKFEGTGFEVNWAFRCSAGPRFFQLVLHGSKLPQSRSELVNRTGRTAFGHHDVFLGKGQTAVRPASPYYFTVSAGKKCYWTLDVRAP